MDYDALAKQFGGGDLPDYDALANAHGGTDAPAEEPSLAGGLLKRASAAAPKAAEVAKQGVDAVAGVVGDVKKKATDVADTLARVPSALDDIAGTQNKPGTTKKAATPQPVPDRSWSEAISDTGKGLVGGAEQTAALAGDVYGLVTGDMNNPVSNLKKDAQETLDDVSPALKAKRANLQGEMDATDGLFSKAAKAFTGTVSDPALLTDFAAQQAPNLAVSAATGRATGGLAKVAGAGEKAIEQSAVAGAVGSGMAQQGADAGGDAYDRLMALPDETWMADADYRAAIEAGTSPEEAKHTMALSLARKAGAASGAVSGALNFLPGATSLERALAGLPSKGAGGMLARAGQGFLGEGANEFGDEGFGQLSSNLATQQIDPNQDPLQYVGEAAGQGAVSGLFGGGAEVFNVPHPTELNSEIGGPAVRPEDPPMSAWPAANGPAPAAPTGFDPGVGGGLLARANLDPKSFGLRPDGTVDGDAIIAASARGEILPLIPDLPKQPEQPAAQGFPPLDNVPKPDRDPTELPAIDESLASSTKPEKAPEAALPQRQSSTTVAPDEKSDDSGRATVAIEKTEQHTVGGLQTEEIPVDSLELSKDVPQFKSGTNEKGVVEPLGGKFERTGVAPIQVWRRKDGRMEVISGRHRLDLARRSGEKTIPAQVHNESDGFDAERASYLDAELNIRDNQGKAKDYVQYFTKTGLSADDAKARGLTSRVLGKRAFEIASSGSPELIAAHRADVIGDEAAYEIARAAPGDVRLQSVGIKAIQDGKNAATAANLIQAIKALGAKPSEGDQGDMFGFDDSAIREAEQMAKLVTAKQRDLSQRINAVQGAAKNPALAQREGIDVKNPDAILKRVRDLKQERAQWDNWSSNSDLVNQIRSEMGAAPVEQSAPEEAPAEEAPQEDTGPDLFGDPAVEPEAAKAPETKKAPEANNKYSDYVGIMGSMETPYRPNGLNQTEIIEWERRDLGARVGAAIELRLKAEKNPNSQKARDRIRYEEWQKVQAESDDLDKRWLETSEEEDKDPVSRFWKSAPFTPEEHAAAFELAKPGTHIESWSMQGSYRVDEATKPDDLGIRHFMVTPWEDTREEGKKAGYTDKQLRYPNLVFARDGRLMEMNLHWTHNEIANELEIYPEGIRTGWGNASNHPEGTSPEETQAIADEFERAEQDSRDDDGWQVHHLFDPPRKKEIFRIQQKVDALGELLSKEELKAELAAIDERDELLKKGDPVPAALTERIAKFVAHCDALEEKARPVVEGWKDHAAAQYEDNEKARSENSRKVVLSLFDRTGKWAEPWEAAGYQVWKFDIQNDKDMGDVNNFSVEFFDEWFSNFDGMDIHAILAACPCTDFAVSGALHFAAKDADGSTVKSIELVEKTLATIEFFKPAIWAIENPTGRIEKLGGLPPWRASVDPFHFGDPYTKKTQLWGRFNGDMPIAPVEPVEGSKIHSKYGGKSLATKNARSVTPEGFAYAFFMANNAHDHPAMALANKFDRLDKDLISAALSAGHSQDEIESEIEDFYYMDMDDNAANEALRELIDDPVEEVEPVKKPSKAPSKQETAPTAPKGSIDDQLANISQQDLSALIDNISNELNAIPTELPGEQRQTIKRPREKIKKPGQPRAKRSPAEKVETGDRQLSEIASSLGVNLSNAGMDALKGLTKLFGGSGKLSSGLSFDEETYAQAKPYFQAMLKDFRAAGKDLAEFVRKILENFGTGAKPYLMRFAEEISNVRTENGQPGEKTLGTVAPGAGSGSESSGGMGNDNSGGGQDGTVAPGGSDAGGVSGTRSGGGRAEGTRPARTGTGSKKPRVGKGGTGEDGEGVPANSVAPPAAPNIPAANFQIDSSVELGKGGEVAKFNDNIAAIQTLVDIERDNRRATPEEQRTLARYVGWGGLANAFPDPITKEFKPAWKDRGEMLSSLLSKREYKTAISSTRNAHYTSETVVSAMWEAVEHMGFRGGLALETSAGVGNFLGLKPAGLDGNTRFVAVEYDSITARIAALLYPQETVLNTGFQKVPLPDNAFALSIGNPPFGSESLRFQYKPELRGQSIHNQFFRASMDSLRPGGLQAMVVSSFLMDAQDSTTRRALAENAELVAAIRLPDTAFKENARTEVVTDIIFLKKRTPAEASLMKSVLQANDKPESKRSTEERRLLERHEIPEWIETGEIKDPLGGEKMRVNSYFVNRPRMVMGTIERSGSMYQKGSVNVRLDDPSRLQQMLKDAVARLPTNVVDISDEVIANTQERHQSLSDALRIAISGEEPGSLKIDQDGNLMQVFEKETPEGGYEFTRQKITANTPWSPRLYLDSQGNWYSNEEVLDEKGEKVKAKNEKGQPTKRNLYERRVYGKAEGVPESLRLGATRHERLLDIVRVRDLLKRQIILETEDAESFLMEENRTKLAAAYDSYVAKHGPVSRDTTVSLANTMPDGALVMALEVGYRPAVTAARAAKSGLPESAEFVEKAPIMQRRVIPKYEPATSAENAADALVISLSERGRVDLERISSLLGISEEEAIKQLQSGSKPLIFRDPETETWETADAYLSGQVRRKLEAAKNSGMSMNVEALEAVQPEPWTAENVTPSMGATWIPTSVYADFVEHLTGGKAKVNFFKLTNTFGVTVAGINSGKASAWGTDSVSAQYIVEKLMNSQGIVVTTKNADGNMVVDQMATAIATSKAKEIYNEFADWTFANADRRKLLVDTFNDKFNTRVGRQHDGSHLTLPGKVPDEIIELRRHQKNAVWRGIVERFMLFDHVVGAGKTFTAIARVMERRRMGLSKKPMIVVPNHLVEQFAADTYRLYPGAKVLAAGQKDFEAKKRRRLFAKIATGDWDVVIVPHSSFGFIGIDPNTEERYLEKALKQALDAVKEAQEAADEEGVEGFRTPFGVKQAQRLVDKITQKLEGLKNKPRDSMLTFEQLGVDDLTVDEAHEFKNLFYSSKMSSKVRGMGDKIGSKKASDLYDKVRVLGESPTGTVTFMTGTPISNSAVEMYTMMRYLASNELADLGLEHFDAWRANSVEFADKMEPTEGGRLKLVSRLGRSWSNMRALMELYYQFTDSVSIEDIKKSFAEDNPGKEFPIPKIKGGERTLVTVKPTDAQVTALNQLLADIDGLESISDPYKRNAERLRLMDRSRKLSLDIRAMNAFSTSKEVGGKLEKATDEIFRIYKKSTPDRGTQLVFLDRSVPKAKGDDKVIKAYDALIEEKDAALSKGDEEAFQAASEKLEKFDPDEIAELRTAQKGGWNAYKQIKDNLVARGVPANEVRFIQEANTDDQKQELFDAVKGGRVRVLIGSTQRMGAGTNVQDRLVGLHHVDVNWRPSDIEQREGRIIRQGNKLLEKYGKDFEVEIIAYATERSMDAKMWDLNSTKLRMINAIRNYDGSFNMDFGDEDADSMAEMAAIASGDPLLLERVKLETEITGLELLERGHRRRVYNIQDQIDQAEKAIAENEAKAENLKTRATEFAGRVEAVKEAAEKRTVKVEGEEYASQFGALSAAEQAIKAQQGEDDKGPWSLSVNGKRFTNKSDLNDEIGATLGDDRPFEAEIYVDDLSKDDLQVGQKFFQRGGAAREVAKIIKRVQGELSESDPSKSVSVGELFGYQLELDVSKSKPPRSEFTVSLSMVSEGKTIASYETGYNDGKLTTTAVRELFSKLAYYVESNSNVQYSVDQLLRIKKEAERDLPGLKESISAPFKQAADLQRKRKRLADVVAELTAKDPKTKQTLEANEDAGVYELDGDASDLQRQETETREGLEVNAGPAPTLQRDLFAPTRVPQATATTQAEANYRLKVEQVGSRTFKVATQMANTHEEAAHVLHELSKRAQEEVLVIVTDDKGKIMNVIGHTKGDRDAASVYMQVLTSSIAATPNAAKVWLSHNHPSGVSDPSSADEYLTKVFKKDVESMGFEYLGHVVLGRDDYTFIEPQFPQTKQRNSYKEYGERSRAIEITEQVITRHDPIKITMAGEDLARVTLRDIPGTGVLMLDKRHNVNGFIALSTREMSYLKASNFSGVRRVMSALFESGSSKIIFKVDEAGGLADAAIKNMVEFAYEFEIDVLDVGVVKPDGGIEMQSGLNKMPSAKGSIFFSRSDGSGAVHTATSLAGRMNDVFGKKFMDNLTGAGKFKIVSASEAEEIIGQKVFTKSDDLLSSYTAEDLARMSKVEIDRLKSEAAAKRRQELIDAEGEFTLSGSDSETDKAAAKGQLPLFSQSGVARAFYNKEDSTTYLIADNIPKAFTDDQFRGLMRHEIGVHAMNLGRDSSGFKAILRQVDMLVKAGNPAAANAYRRAQRAGTPEENMLEEVAGYLVEDAPQSSLVRRLLAWFKNQVYRLTGYQMKLTDGDIAAMASSALGNSVSNTDSSGAPMFSRASSSNSGTFDGSNPNILFSRGEGFKNWFGDFVKTNQKVNLWSRTVGTMYDLAQRVPQFKPVFDAGQRYLNDTSRVAVEAESLAPDLFRQMTSWKKARKTGKAESADVEKSAEAVYAGTLDDQKLYTDAELTDKGLTPVQIGLYRQAITAAHKSLDDLTKATLHRMAASMEIPRGQLDRIREDTDNAEDFLERVYDDVLREARQTLSDRIAILEDDQDEEGVATARAEKKRLDDAISDLYKTTARANKLKEQGYFPLMRFGKHTVDVVTETANGNVREYFGMYESEADANKMARLMKEQFPDSTVSTGIASQDDWRLFPGLNPEVVKAFAEATGNEANAFFQDYIRIAVSNRSALKRLINRKGVPGFSKDLKRSLASFVLANSRMAANHYQMGSMREAYNAIPKAMGDVKDQAGKLMTYLQNPQEEFGSLRGFMFFHFLGGSLSAAITNLTQLPMVSSIYLGKFGGASKLLKWAALRKPSNQAHKDALKRAEEEGVVSPQEVHNLMATARGGTLGPGKLLSTRPAQTVLFWWGSMFSAAEQYNRTVTFNAAFDLAQEKRMADPYAFAVKAVQETQFVYNRGNRPNWARGVGAPLMTFKQFSISYLEMLNRMPTKQKLLMVALLVAAAGVEGLPFEEDIEDVIDTIAQWRGYAWTTRKELDSWANTHLGKFFGPLLTRGVSGIGIPIDVQSRLGMGNLIPGTAFLKPSELDPGKELLDVFGAPGGLLKSIAGGLKSAARGDIKGAAVQLLPRAVQNFEKGVEMALTGKYENTQGQPVTDASGAEAAMKIIGFQPTRVADVQRARRSVDGDVKLHRLTEDAILDAWAVGIRMKDRGAVDAAKDKLKEWNVNNPDTPIAVSTTQLLSRLKALNMSQNQRYLKTVPKEMRRSVGESLGQE